MGHVIEIEENEFEKFIHEHEYVLVDFSAIWCGPCKMMEPVIDQISDQYVDKLNVLKVDVDNYPIVTAKYGIRTIPTILIFQNKNIIFKHSGAAPKSFFEKKLNDLFD